MSQPQSKLQPDETDPLTWVSNLVREHRSSLAATARLEGLSAEDAVDCVQEGICSLLQFLRTHPTPPTPSEQLALLTTIVKNAARNRRRRHFLQRPHTAYDDSTQRSDTTPPSDELIAIAEEHVRLRNCVNDLCEIQRAVVTLRMLEELPGDNVAVLLGISESHVAVLLHRAKSALRECMTR